MTATGVHGPSVIRSSVLRTASGEANCESDVHCHASGSANSRSVPMPIFASVDTCMRERRVRTPPTDSSGASA